MKFIITIYLFFFINCSNVENKKELTFTTKNANQKDSIKNYLLDKINYQKDSIKNYLLGKIDYQEDTNFIKIDKKMVDKNMANRNSYLLKKVYDAYKAMYLAAKKDTINLIILSATRSFCDQKGIWENKWKNNDSLSDSLRALKVLEFSSMPGTSRHHWGTDVDLNSWENSYFENGEGELIFKWLDKNASKFGFYQVYTKKKNNNRTGYNQENWHWSYLRIADQCLLDYNQEISLNDIKGFTGFETAKKIDIINKYVNGIKKYN